MGNEPVCLEEIFPCWDKIDIKEQEVIKECAELRRFKKGERPHQGSGDCAGLFLVKSGQLRVFILSESGKEITLYRLFAWDICLFSAACIMSNISFEMHVEAEKDTEAFIVPADLYEKLVKKSLPVAHYTNQLMSSRFSDVMWIMEQVLFTSFDSRLAALLLEQRVIEGSNVLLITHDEIARHMGSAREVVTKMLNYLAGEGMLKLARGKITLLDTERLNGLIKTK
ncbi:MAG: Crp/Fnr family transcriptional regulator [Christensenellales bacterium]|jgi:CRP/FNR family transcriptional regulator